MFLYCSANFFSIWSNNHEIKKERKKVLLAKLSQILSLFYRYIDSNLIPKELFKSDSSKIM